MFHRATPKLRRKSHKWASLWVRRGDLTELDGLSTEIEKTGNLTTVVTRESTLCAAVATTHPSSTLGDADVLLWHFLFSTPSFTSYLNIAQNWVWMSSYASFLCNFVSQVNRSWTYYSPLSFAISLHWTNQCTLFFILQIKSCICGTQESHCFLCVALRVYKELIGDVCVCAYDLTPVFMCMCARECKSMKLKCVKVCQ